MVSKKYAHKMGRPERVFATRAIEAGMKPKILQKILGHSNISMTLDLYVHATQDEMQKEMQLLEKLA